MMKYVDWDETKNKLLKRDRDVCFEDVMIAIDEGGALDLIPHPNQKKYPQQQIIVVNINGYAYLVPFVENNEAMFFKTIIPSRKATKKYLIQKS